MYVLVVQYWQGFSMYIFHEDFFLNHSKKKGGGVNALYTYTVNYL